MSLAIGHGPDLFCTGQITSCPDGSYFIDNIWR